MSRRGEEGSPRALQAQAPWAPWTAPVALLGALAIAIAAAMLTGGVAGLAGVKLKPTPPGVLLVSTFLQDAALIGTALIFASLHQHLEAGLFGLRRVQLRLACRGMILAWVVFMLFSLLWVTGLGITERSDLPTKLGADRGPVPLVAVALLLTVVAPIAEELFFRGYFFVALRNWRGPWLAAVITGLVFGAAHAGAGPILLTVPLAVLGSVLCLLYWRTGSLLPCISLHSLNNALALGVAMHWIWQVAVVMVGAHAVLALVLGPVMKLSQRRLAGP